MLNRTQQEGIQHSIKKNNKKNRQKVIKIL